MSERYLPCIKTIGKSEQNRAYQTCAAQYHYSFKEMFSRSDFDDLVSILKGLKGTFILSLNDRPEVRDLFKNFNIKSVETTYTAGGNNKAKKVGEVIISNHTL